MKITELQPKQGNVDVDGEIIEIGELKNISKYGKELKLVDAILKDDSGTIKLTLWNEDATRFQTGDKVKIKNGYVNEFQGDLQLTSGKFGSIEKLDSNQTTLQEENQDDY